MLMDIKMIFAYNLINDQPMDSCSCAWHLLQKGESDIPDRVRKTLNFLDNHQLWCIMSRNTPATSCRDASSRRNRLGNTGIPLSDELRTVCMVYYDVNGDRHYVLLNYRAHLYFDPKNVHKALNADPKRPLARLSPEELNRMFYSEYGTVTPFVDMRKVSYQLFDDSVLQTNDHPPHTMMTNAGDHTWAVELNPAQLVDALKKQYPNQIKVGQFCTQNGNATYRKKPVFGIITGNGPESGMALWEHINRNIRESIEDRYNGDLSFPNVIVNSVPEMGLSMELMAREQAIWNYIEQAVRHLCSGGATHLALACHTTHYYSDKIQMVCDDYGAQFVSMSETAIDYIQNKNLTDITLIGIPYVADLGKWSAYRALSNLNIQPMKEKAREPLLDLGYWVKKTGSDHKGLNKLNHILKIGVTTKNVLIALTEISVLLGGFPKKQNKLGQWNIIDPLKLYGERLADIYLSSFMPVNDFTDEYDDCIPIDTE
jgi:aspartate racemase